jgi:uncharacterized protein YndB with AHSA1/START domain
MFSMRPAASSSKCGPRPNTLALVGAQGVHHSLLHNRFSRRWRVSLLHAIARGPQLLGQGYFREIVEEERIVYTDFLVDEDENVVPPTYYGMSAEWPEETLVTVTFVEHDGKTTLTVYHVGIPAGTKGDMAEAAWIESLQHLQEILADIK